ncbi:hypothetical protein HDE_10692 [Halotydeus destructor]|nr:hypothetical protein HDE_10692 [Halotydeus destructor]
MGVKLLKISLTINVVSLIMGITIVLVVLVLTMWSAGKTAHSGTGSQSELFGYFLSLGPLLIVNSLCGITASQRSSVTTVTIYLLTVMATVAMGLWVTFGHLTVDNLVSLKHNKVQILCKLIVVICLGQLLAGLLIVVTSWLNHRSSKDTQTTHGHLNGTSVLDDRNLEEPLRMVSMTSESSR